MQEDKIDGQVVYKGKIVDLKVDRVLLPNGKEAKREVVVHKGAVAIAAVTPDQEIILIRQFRYPAGEILWEIPAGKLEIGEDPEDCAKRELAEETGYGARVWKKLSTFYTSPGFSDEIMHLYLATDLYPKKLNADDDEFIEIYKIPYARAAEMIIGQEIRDCKTISGILMAGLMNNR